MEKSRSLNLKKLRKSHLPYPISQGKQRETQSSRQARLSSFTNYKFVAVLKQRQSELFFSRTYRQEREEQDKELRKKLQLDSSILISADSWSICLNMGV